MRRDWWSNLPLAVFLVIVLVLVICALTIPADPHTSAEKGYTQPTSQTVSWLIVQERTLDRQLADRALLVQQRADTVERACTLISTLDRPSNDVATWSASHCVKGEK